MGERVLDHVGTDVGGRDMVEMTRKGYRGLTVARGAIPSVMGGGGSSRQ